MLDAEKYPDVHDKQLVEIIELLAVSPGNPLAGTAGWLRE